MKGLKKIKTVSITASNIQNFTPTINLDVQPKIWELPNRKAYMNWFLLLVKHWLLMTA